MSINENTTSIRIEANAKIWAADRAGSLTYQMTHGNALYEVDTWVGLIRATQSQADRVSIVGGYLVYPHTKAYKSSPPGAGSDINVTKETPYKTF